MMQTCRKCAHVNPPEAVYCYRDGYALDAEGRSGGPVAVGSKPFGRPFVFPSGRSCASFDELALACQDNWAEALQLLKQGYLQNFLGGLGRSDLAKVANEAAQFPDPNLGLNQFLERLPNQVLVPPQLRVEPQEINLGYLAVGKDIKFDLTLQNRGGCLLHGSVSCADSPWLTLGDGTGSPRKVFQISSEVGIPVRIIGKNLRASAKPLEGRLVVDTNGGIYTLTVRLQVPIKPFAAGALAGAVSPRQIAEKAKAFPKEAAELFEKGAVAQWYKENGWTYPVQTPTSYGLGAVQQFFEALGLTPPPKVEISERAVALEGKAGAQLAHALEVRSPEKRPVWAHASSDVPWLEIGRARLNGNAAVIPLVVPRIPDRAGETLRGNVTVTANGKQSFTVPVTLTIGENFSFAAQPLPQPLPVASLAPPAAAEMVTAIPPVSRPLPRGRERSAAGLGWGPLIPAGLLLLVLLGVLVWDFVAPSVSVTPTRASGAGWDLEDSAPRLGVEFHRENMRFGILMLREADPQNPDKHKRLTYEEAGSSNNTCLMIDNFEYLFGRCPPGKWRKKMVEIKGRQGWYSTVEYPERVVVTQTVEVVPGEQTRLLDTLLVRYTVENQSKVPRKVGLRIMLDTFIGANDGVPFAIPGQQGLLDTMRDFDEKDIPDYIQALEHADLKNPGTVAHMGLKGFKLAEVDLEPIEKLRICRWPGNRETLWDWKPTAMNQPAGSRKDSCVTLYWAYRKMNPAEKRELAFTYGLNTIAGGSSESEGKLGITVGGSFRPGGEFTVTAYVKNPEEGQKVKLTLPGGMSLVKGQEEEQTVKQGGDYTQVSWRVRCGPVGTHTLEVSSGRLRERYKVPIRSKSFLD